MVKEELIKELELTKDDFLKYLKEIREDWLKDCPELPSYNWLMNIRPQLLQNAIELCKLIKVLKMEE